MTPMRTAEVTPEGRTATEAATGARRRAPRIGAVGSGGGGGGWPSPRPHTPAAGRPTRFSTRPRRQSPVRPHRSVREREVLVHGAHRRRSFAHGGGDALGRAGTNI